MKQLARTPPPISRLIKEELTALTQRTGTRRSRRDRTKIPAPISSVLTREPEWHHPDWLTQTPTDDEWEWIKWFVTRGWNTEMVEQAEDHGALDSLMHYKVIDDMLRDAGYRADPVSGHDNDELVRELIFGTAAIIRLHAQADIDGLCIECNKTHPCQTYRLATRTGG